MPVADLLLQRGATIRFHDPLVDTWQLESGPIMREQDLNEALDTADIVVLLQAHNFYDLEDVASRAKVLLDTRGVAPAPAFHL